MKVSGVGIDYLSFTLRTGRFKDVESLILEDANNEMDKFDTTGSFRAWMNAQQWNYRTGRRPYQRGRENTEKSVFVWLGGQEHVQVEVTGQGCESLRESGILDSTMFAFRERLTRLDIAIDYLTDVTPKYATAERAKRIKAYTIQESDTGSTAYVGSRKSEAFCRVYRYAPPHPRHNKLRCEFQLRKPQTIAIVNQIGAYGLNHTAQSLLNKFELSALGRVDDMSDKFRPISQDRSEDKKLTWLRKQVAPAVHDLLRKRVITEEDVYALFVEPVADKIESVDGERQQRLL